MGSGREKLHGILSTILAENAHKRTNGRVASDRTTTAYGEVLRMGFDVLYEIGYRIENPRNINETHIKALCEYWHGKNKAISTIQDYLSKFRIFSGWIGKKGMVKSLPDYLPNIPKQELRVTKVAKVSKGWTENGVNISEKIALAENIDKRFSLMLRMMLAFGLRRKEVMHTRVWKADHGNKLVIYPGEAKGGRPRDIFIDNNDQRQVLDYVKSQVGKTEPLGWHTKENGTIASLAYNIKRYNRLMASIGITKLKDGVTGHGLRAQYAENSALIAGLIPPTLGGSANQMEKDVLDLKRAQISELLGHSRIIVTAAYYGAFKYKTGAPIDRLALFQINMETALNKIPPTTLLNVPEEHKAHCRKMVEELEEFDVCTTIKHIHYLWEQHSKRFASPWASPQHSNLAALQVVAMRLNGEKVDDQ
ncbi:hypothetical protein GTP23_21400 [Pseudoduganella sp. FT93W]|uniref:Tyrosine-type recombinase/integrase n=1 Tax=Duganella fentianensis TaxID=2692177 RepID=A0A845I5V5_9BURK|nr:site-specific integrase [Duganella fentianensis]MYN47605.1 hypothetical protein [Duganella fentianensis]